MSPVRIFSCTNCGHRFEKSRVVADSSLTMTLCSRCGSDQVEIVGDGLRDPRACRGSGGGESELAGTARTR